VAVNKADGDNKRRAEMARRDYDNALHMFPPSQSGWQPRAVTCSARTGDGIRALWDAVLEHQAATIENGWFERSRCEQSKRWMHDMIEWGLRDRFRRNPEVEARLHELEADVAAGRVSAFRAAQQLLSIYDQSRGEQQ
jgi:LAO/AO transport system kinase